MVHCTNLFAFCLSGGHKNSQKQHINYIYTFETWSCKNNYLKKENYFSFQRV